MLALLAVFASLFTEMSLEEKVGQLLMVHFNGEKVNEDAVTLVQEIGVGGVMYYNWANGLHSKEQVAQLSSQLQELAAIPLFIAADQEGGVVCRLQRGFTVFPGNGALGAVNDVQLAEDCAFTTGSELLAAGVNFNLAPVVDVNSNPRNPVIGLRSFGSDPESVTRFAKAALIGYKKAGVLTSLKHFPGHGDVEVDSHEDLPVIKKSKKQLQKVELLPFFALADQADTVMTAHVLVPEIDPLHCATLSKKVLDILRSAGFQGVIITDSLVMEGLLKTRSSVDAAAIDALNAGCDLLMLGGKQLTGASMLELTVSDVKRIHRSLVDAVKSGVVSEKRLDEAVQRVLRLKDKCKFQPGLSVAGESALAKKVASLALKTVERKSVGPLRECKVALFAPDVVREGMENAFSKVGKETHLFFFKGLAPSEEEMKMASVWAEKADLLIICSYNAWRNKPQADLIHSLSNKGKPVVSIVLRDLLDVDLFPKADLIVETFSPTAPSIQAACDKLVNLAK